MKTTSTSRKHKIDEELENDPDIYMYEGHPCILIWDKRLKMKRLKALDFKGGKFFRKSTVHLSMIKMGSSSPNRPDLNSKISTDVFST